MEMRSVKAPDTFAHPPTTFNKEENAGLLGNYYQEAASVGDALQKRRQKLAQDKIGLGADAEDSDPGPITGKTL